MNKIELTESIAKIGKMGKAEAASALESVFEAITKGLKAGKDVRVTGFGTFSVAARSARKGRNPQTGAVVSIAASKAARFKAGKALKEALNAKKR